MSINDFKDKIAQEFMSSSDVKRLYKLTGNESFNERFPSVSIEGVFIYLWAVGAWIISQMFLKHRKDVEVNLENLKPHNLRWYVSKAKKYQHGDTLPVDENGLVNDDQYETIDVKKQIIKYAVAQEVDSSLLIKTAKYQNENDSTPIKLNEAELAGLKNYIAEIKDAGVPISIISNDADLLSLTITIYYDPMALTIHDNVLIDADGNDVIRLAVEHTIENLPFNGALKKSDIIDSINQLKGIAVVDITDMKLQATGEIEENIIGYCTPKSGYVKIKSLSMNIKPYNYGNEI